MRNAILLAIAVSIAAHADGRVYYMENLDGRRNPVLADQQSSRDLDLSFSAGEPIESESSVGPPIRKVYTVVAPEKPYIELSREAERPISYYRLIEPATARRSNFDDVVLVPERSRKLMKLNGNGKGEVILELRVIANHDSE